MSQRRLNLLNILLVLKVYFRTPYLLFETIGKVNDLFTPCNRQQEHIHVKQVTYIHGVELMHVVTASPGKICKDANKVFCFYIRKGNKGVHLIFFY